MKLNNGLSVFSKKGDGMQEVLFKKSSLIKGYRKSSVLDNFKKKWEFYVG